MQFFYIIIFLFILRIFIPADLKKIWMKTIVISTLSTCVQINSEPQMHVLVNNAQAQHIWRN